MSESCLIKSYQQLVSLDDAELEFLSSLEKDQRAFSKGETIVEQGDDSKMLHVVSGGWAMSQVCDAHGRRQILEVHLCGDIVGTREVAFSRRLSSLVAVSDVTACPFPRHRLNALFETSPRLSAVFMLIAMRREAMLSERVFDLGRRDAISRVCHFVWDIRARCAHSDAAAGNRVEQRFTQQQLADALGLTSVHVNRVIRRLREEGVAEFSRDAVIILDLPKLRQYADLNENYLDVDSSWVDHGAFERGIS